MTHSGGKPHAVGDRGQRYEVSFFDPAANRRRVLGWTDTSEAARGFADAVEKHPSWELPQILDRETTFGSKALFEQHIRELRRPDIGSDADTLTEADFVCELAEDGWPDHCKWLAIWCRLNDGGGELSPPERRSALAYWHAGDDGEIPQELRLP